MKIKQLLSVMTILAAGWTGSAAYGQQAAYQPIYPAPAPLAPEGAPPPPYGSVVPAGGVLSDWIRYQRDCCDGNHGKVTPLFTELYLRAGPSFPVSGTLGRELVTGWSVVGGGRALFFEETQTRAWVVDLHIINTSEDAGSRNTRFPLVVFHNNKRFIYPGATVAGANRTLVGLGLGREWYLWASADAPGLKWRAGVDLGGRYGTQRVILAGSASVFQLVNGALVPDLPSPRAEFGHVTDVIGSSYAAIHTDLEFPWHCCLVHVGLRFEWAYTWSDILQRTSDVQDLSLLVSAGVRF